MVREFFTPIVLCCLRARRGDRICMRSTGHTLCKIRKAALTMTTAVYTGYVGTDVPSAITVCVLIRRQDNKIVRGEPPACFPRKNKHLFFTIFMRFAYDNVIANRKFERFIVSLYLE